ncbi:hypothetical protein GQ54DRAFT_174039 [Martensiomyces pterosporus]|nr:hypothetical protein GQ54DRAFT_174039 [Martensiomyces pterosporus]
MLSGGGRERDCYFRLCPVFGRECSIWHCSSLQSRRAFCWPPGLGASSALCMACKRYARYPHVHATLL